MPADLGRRIPLLTYVLPLIVVFHAMEARPADALAAWTPALLFALLLGVGPHIGKIGTDLFPAVRALGAMQTVLAMGIGAGAVMFGQWLWDVPWNRWFGNKKVVRVKPGEGVVDAVRRAHGDRGDRGVARRCSSHIPAAARSTRAFVS